MLADRLTADGRITVCVLEAGIPANSMAAALKISEKAADLIRAPG